VDGCGCCRRRSDIFHHFTYLCIMSDYAKLRQMYVELKVRTDNLEDRLIDANRKIYFLNKEITQMKIDDYLNNYKPKSKAL